MVALPPLLQEHINHLNAQGYKIEVGGSDSEYCIVFKDYPIPNHIWDKEKVDLLVLAHPTYPNSKLDMFWVDPEIKSKEGNRKPKAGDVFENHCGKNWQRFSWHPPSWNPAFDNLITYLEVINHRLNKGEWA